MRSRTGCLTCRQRKLKCDEKKPVCGQCIKASRECVPSSGIVFRHQHNASMNGDDSGDDNSLKGFYAYKNTFEEDTIWMDIPKNVTFINTTNPYLDPGTPDFETMSVTSMDSPPQRVAQPLSSWRTQSSFPSVTSTPSNMGPDLVPVSIPMSYTPELESLPPLSQSPSMSLAGTPVSPPPSYLSNRIHPIINYSHSHSATPPPIDPCLPNYISRPASVSSARRSPARSEPDFGESDREITFLLRWFQESPGSWMDLFDLGTYFTSNIPAMAAESPLIKYAAVACAAKSLARLNGCKPALTGVPPQGHLELYPGSSLVDWKHKAAVYYDNAVSLLLHALKTEPTITPDDSDCEFGPESFNGRSPKRRRTSSNTSVVTSSDDLLAASAILCVYEFLDSSMSEWAKHLDGAKSLLVLTQDQMTPFQLPTPTSSISSGSFNFISKTRKATFWNIARQDMQAALIHQTHTRLDTENLSLWQDAGLVIDDQGFIIPSTKTECGFLEESEIIDTCCNTLVWLMSKLVNFVATGDASTPTGGSWTHVPQRTTLDNWRKLQQQFQVWYDGLPAAFKPSARVPSNPAGSFMKSGMDPIFSEVWYSMPMCAATMQTYHMSQILLFMNKPHEATQGQNSVCAQLNSYQSVLASCQKHSREIVGISLARPDEAVRIHSVQPLFTAGQCLNDVRERQVVLDLLRGLESEIGWATNTRVQQLVQQWHWEEQEVRVP